MAYSTLSEGDWIKYLNMYCIGEKHGADLIHMLLEFCPPSEKEWIIKWNKEEEFHHKLWSKLMKAKKIKAANLTPSLSNMYMITEKYVRNKNWAGSMVGAAIIEHMSNSAAIILYEYADESTKAIFKRIVGDDVGHLDFDIRMIRQAAGSKNGRNEIMRVHKRFLDEFLDWPDREHVTDMDLRILNYGYSIHRVAMERIGVSIPHVLFERSFRFMVKKALLKMAM
jgi:hypothetical protein